ncbi:putative oligopeptide transporter [Phaeomoniella chlamydospora]|uniref:Putative oligopeptide transporter n=1 Tax=Phaeomoniella chlamydospora TaxID=158046 RepID=A0A0G2GKI1_PHACM|nr:putative oligopeptide transporter [Phaeomoniella chlamydospora]
MTMSPDRGASALRSTGEGHSGATVHGGQAVNHSENENESQVAEDDPDNDDIAELSLHRSQSDHGAYNRMAHTSATEGTNFTFRGVLVGSLIGIVICFSNTYFGLQTGWVSGMAMPASLIGFAVFKSISRFLKVPFTPVENVLVQTVAGAVGMEPLGCGFVGVMPALQFLLKQEEGAPLDMGIGKLLAWGTGISLFGVVFAVPLRREVIIREKLKFPSGTATALMIGVLHGVQEKKEVEDVAQVETEETETLLRPRNLSDDSTVEGQGDDARDEWKGRIRLLSIAFTVSAIYTLVQYFIPQLRNIPIFGLTLANVWQWTLNPSPAYMGQGIIMGPATTIHMLLGAIIGWGILSPLAKKKGWASGSVDDWEEGSKGWIVWVSLAIMLADAVLNLGWLFLRPLLHHGPEWYLQFERAIHTGSWKDFSFVRDHIRYSAIETDSAPGTPLSTPRKTTKNAFNDTPDDAPAHHLIPTWVTLIMLPATMVLCVVCVHVSFGDYIPVSLTIFAIILSIPLSIMGVRALGETDLNPVSGISKLTQLVFALVTPSNSPNAIVINLIAGAISEAGALQAGDMLQDLKAGHLLNASPRAQFYGQMIGSIIGAFAATFVYKLYVNVYNIPSDMFQVPTGYVWIFTARLVTGKGLPPMAWQFSLAFGILFLLTTSLRIYLSLSSSPKLKSLHPYIPGGIAVAVGMYNTPSFTLARTIGGLISLYWVKGKNRSETVVIVLASGLILGEGVMSILGLGLASVGVPHL